MQNVKQIFRNQKEFENKQVKLSGWIRNNRAQKEFGFIDFHDGTFFNSVQIVYESNLDNFKDVQKFRVGSSIEVEGKLVLTPKMRQPFEIKATKVELVREADSNYPIQPKRHSREFLREQAYLRSKTNLFQAVFRVRSVASMAIHEFFQEKGFIYTHTPIITSNDGEGVGEMFNVTTLDLKNIKKDEKGNVDFKKDFFGKETFLTVTGQLQGAIRCHSGRQRIRRRHGLPLTGGRGRPDSPAGARRLGEPTGRWSVGGSDS